MLQSFQRLKAVIFLSLLLGGCGAVPYQAPTAGSTAQVIVRHATTSGTSHLYTYGDVKSCSGLQRVVGNVVRIPEDFEFKIKADEPAGLQYNNVVGNRYCVIAMQFDPKPNGKYVVSIRSDAVGCAIGIYDASSGDLMPEPTRKRLLPSAGGMSCRAVAMPSTGNSSNGSGVDTSPASSGMTLDDLKGLK